MASEPGGEAVSPVASSASTDSGTAPAATPERATLIATSSPLTDFLPTLEQMGVRKSSKERVAGSGRRTSFAARLSFMPSRRGPSIDDESEDEDGEGQYTEQKLMHTFIDVEMMKEKVRQSLLNPVKTGTDFYKQHAVSSYVARHYLFENVTLCVIGINAIWIAHDTDANDSAILVQAAPKFIVAENLFCFFFASELMIRFLAFECKRNIFLDPWFLFDAALVISMVLETWVMSSLLLVVGMRTGSFGGASVIRIARLLRLTRMARMARLLRVVPELMILIKGMFAAVRSVLFTILLLVCIMYVFGIGLTQLAAGTPLQEEYFESVPAAMYCLLMRGCLLDSPTEVSDNLMSVDWYYPVVFWLFILVATLTVMNMLVGVLCEVVSAVAATEREENLVSFVKSKVLNIIDKIDKDGNMEISKSEFVQILENSSACRALQDVGVDVVGLVDLADTIFEDETGQEIAVLSFADFMDLVLQLRGTNLATVKDIVQLRKMLHNVMSRLDDVTSVVCPDKKKSKRVAVRGNVNRSMSSACVELTPTGKRLFESTRDLPASLHLAGKDTEGGRAPVEGTGATDPAAQLTLKVQSKRSVEWSDHAQRSSLRPPTEKNGNNGTTEWCDCNTWEPSRAFGGMKELEGLINAKVASCWEACMSPDFPPPLSEPKAQQRGRSRPSSLPTTRFCEELAKQPWGDSQHAHVQQERSQLPLPNFAGLAAKLGAAGASVSAAHPSGPAGAGPEDDLLRNTAGSPEPTLHGTWPDGEACRDLLGVVRLSAVLAAKLQELQETLLKSAAARMAAATSSREETHDGLLEPTFGDSALPPMTGGAVPPTSAREEAKAPPATILPPPVPAPPPQPGQVEPTAGCAEHGRGRKAPSAHSGASTPRRPPPPAPPDLAPPPPLPGQVDPAADCAEPGRGRKADGEDGMAPTSTIGSGALPAKVPPGGPGAGGAAGSSSPSGSQGAPAVAAGRLRGRGWRQGQTKGPGLPTPTKLLESQAKAAPSDRPASAPPPRRAG